MSNYERQTKLEVNCPFPRRNYDSDSHIQKRFHQFYHNITLNHRLCPWNLMKFDHCLGNAVAQNMAIRSRRIACARVAQYCLPDRLQTNISKEMECVSHVLRSAMFCVSCVQMRLLSHLKIRNVAGPMS